MLIIRNPGRNAAVIGSSYYVRAFNNEHTCITHLVLNLSFDTKRAICNKFPIQMKFINHEKKSLKYQG